MSLSANFPEEPWLRLRLGMESVQGGGAAVSSVHPERLFAKSCYERQGAGLSGLQGEGQMLEATDLASAPGEATELLASSLGSWALPFDAVPRLCLKLSAILGTQTSKPGEAGTRETDVLTLASPPRLGLRTIS